MMLKLPTSLCSKFPKDVERQKEWLKRISRKDFTPSLSLAVCIKHFSACFIKRTINRIMSNILLNNYTKIINNKLIDLKKSKKLATLDALSAK